MNRRGHIVLLASVIVVAAILIVVSSLAFHSLCNRSIGGDYSHRWSNVGTVVSIDHEAQSFVMTVGEGSAEVLFPPPFDAEIEVEEAYEVNKRAEDADK